MIDENITRFANALPDSVIVYNSSLEIMLMNEQAKTSFLHFHRETTNILDLFPQQAKKDFLKPNSQWITQFRSQDKVEHFLLVTVQQYTDVLFLLMVKDISHTHKLEAMRQDFIANVSHELRTPLTVFHGYLTILKDKLDVPQDKLKEIIEQMSGQVDRMERLVEDLLLLSRLESYEPDHQQHLTVSVVSLLKDILHDAMALSEGHHVFQQDWDDNVVIVGQVEELRSAFSNLIYNAIRYTPSGGRITLRWYQRDKTAVFEVEDNGIGILEKHVDRITQRFYQVDKSRTYRGIGGTGLGLAIVKHVLIRHGGELEIKSELGAGSLFRCLFPLP